MLKEEWRIHAQLFGGQAFALFPVLVASMSSLIYAVVYMADISPLGIMRGLHIIMFFLGLNVGTIGFISRDAIENVLGEQNLLVFSSRTLPLSRPHILLVFLVKDFLYYTFLMIAPILAGLMPSALYFGTPLSTFPLLWLTTASIFMLGVSLSFVFAALYQQSRAYTACSIAIVLAVIALMGPNAAQLTPLAFFLLPSVQTAVTGFLPILGATVIGLALFSQESRRRKRTATDRFSRYSTKLSSILDVSHPITLKSMIEISRSSGGLFKLPFSQGVIFLLFIFFVVYIPEMYPAPSTPLLALSIILSIASLTTYSWINRFDRATDYLKLPVGINDVFREKLHAFFALSLPIGYGYLVLAGLFFGFDQFLLSAVMLPLLYLFMFGTTAYVAGLNADRMLFDVQRFTIFTGILGLVVVPLFVLIFLITGHPYLLAALLFGISVMAAAAGHTMYETAQYRWKENH